MHFYAFSTNHQRSALISIWLTLTTSRIGRGLVEINATNTIFCQVSDARSGPTPVLLPRAGCCKYIIITILNSVSCDEHYCKCFVYNDSGNENDCLERLWKWGGEFLRDFHFCVLYNILNSECGKGNLRKLSCLRLASRGNVQLLSLGLDI